MLLIEEEPLPNGISWEVSEKDGFPNFPIAPWRPKTCMEAVWIFTIVPPVVTVTVMVMVMVTVATIIAQLSKNIPIHEPWIGGNIKVGMRRMILSCRIPTFPPFRGEKVVVSVNKPGMIILWISCFIWSCRHWLSCRDYSLRFERISRSPELLQDGSDETGGWDMKNWNRWYIAIMCSMVLLYVVVSCTSRGWYIS